MPGLCGSGLARRSQTSVSTCPPPTVTLHRSVNICLRTYCVSRCQEMASGACIFLGIWGYKGNPQVDKSSHKAVT